MRDLLHRYGVYPFNRTSMELKHDIATVYVIFSIDLLIEPVWN